MITELAILQFSLMFLFALACMAALLIIFFQTHPLTIYRNQPSLACLLLANFASAAVILPFSVIWILFCLRIIDTDVKNEAILVISGTVAQSLSIVYDCVTIGVFLQRNYYLAFPLRCTKQADRVVGCMVAVCSVVAVVLVTSSNVSSLGFQTELQHDCFSFNCILLPNTIARICNLSFKCVGSVVNVILGVAFLIVLKRSKVWFNSAMDNKVNRFLMYIFILRCVFETAPFYVDLFSTLILRVNIGLYIGAYGAQEWALDICCTSISYYLLLVKKPRESSKIFQSTPQNIPISH